MLLIILVLGVVGVIFFATWNLFKYTSCKDFLLFYFFWYFIFDFKLVLSNGAYIRFIDLANLITILKI